MAIHVRSVTTMTLMIACVLSFFVHSTHGCSPPPCIGNMTFSPPAREYIKHIGDAMPNITCSNDCNPSPCTFFWYRQNDKKRMSNNSVLSLGTLESGDDQLYWCAAQTSTKSGGVLQTESIDIKFGCNYPPCIGAMTFSPMGREHHKHIGDVMPNITCSADCNPPSCNFYWYRYSDKKQMSNNNVLSLGKLKAGDNQLYVCSASLKTKAGSMSHSESVDIEFGCDNPPCMGNITFDPPNTIYHKKIGDVMPSITCSAECNPAVCAFFWYRASDKKRISNTSVLSLGTLKSGDDQVYMCSATLKTEAGIEGRTGSIEIEFAQ